MEICWSLELVVRWLKLVSLKTVCECVSMNSVAFVPWSFEASPKNHRNYGVGLCWSFWRGLSAGCAGDSIAEIGKAFWIVGSSLSILSNQSLWNSDPAKKLCLDMVDHNSKHGTVKGIQYRFLQDLELAEESSPLARFKERWAWNLVHVGQPLWTQGQCDTREADSQQVEVAEHLPQTHRRTRFSIMLRSEPPH